jgi:DNA-binding IclR family transcriptional regulator
VFAASVTITGYAAIAVPVFDAGKQLRCVLTLIYRTDRPHRKKAELLSQTREASIVF